MPATEQDRITYIENEMVELRADIAATNKGISDLGKTVTELASVVRVTHAEHQGAREMLKQELAANPRVCELIEQHVAELRALVLEAGATINSFTTARTF